MPGNRLANMKEMCSVLEQVRLSDETKPRTESLQPQYRLRVKTRLIPAFGLMLNPL